MSQLGKVGQPPIRLGRTWPLPTADGAWQIFCPFLDGVDANTAFWIGGLAWHDANASLLAALPTPAPIVQTVFAGVFCIDPFRRDVDIFAALRQAGIQGIVNLPSVSFFDGELATILDSFNLGIAQELDFLRRARAAGFRIAACLPVGGPIAQAVDAGAELIIAHDGPPQPGQTERSSAAAALRLRRQFPGGPPVIGAEDLLATLAT